MLKKRLLKSMYILEAFSLIFFAKNTIITNFQSIKMKICRVVPILDTVGHMTNYTCIGPVVIVNLILFSISGPSTFLVSKLRFEVFNMICVSSFSDSFRKNFWEAEGFHANFKVFRLGSNFRSQLGMAFRVDSLNLSKIRAL